MRIFNRRFIVAMASAWALGACGSESLPDPTNQKGNTGNGGAASMGAGNGGQTGQAQATGGHGTASGVARGGQMSTAGGSGAGGASGTNKGTTSLDGGAKGSVNDAAPTTGQVPHVTDLENTGPYTSTTVNPSGPNDGYSLFYPEQLAPNGVKSPIIAWGSGGSTNPSWYTLLPHLASHGFVVIGSNAIPAIGAEIQQGQDMLAGIDWLLAENGKQGSVFFQKLDPSKIAAMGYSMGGLATFTIASDPRLVTTVHISGGNQTAGRIDNLRAIAAFFCGDQPIIPGADMLVGDVARPQCDTDFEQAATPVFYGNFIGGSHLGIITSPIMERIRVAVTGWLRWQLMGDTTLKSMFVGDQCAMCKDPNWSVQQKNLK